MGNNCSKVKRMACIMLSAISIANFGIMNSVRGAGALDSANELLTTLSNAEVEETLKLAKVVVNDRKKTFYELESKEQELFKRFAKSVFTGGDDFSGGMSLARLYREANGGGQASEKANKRIKKFLPSYYFMKGKDEYGAKRDMLVFPEDYAEVVSIREHSQSAFNELNRVLQRDGHTSSDIDFKNVGKLDELYTTVAGKLSSGSSSWEKEVQAKQIVNASGIGDNLAQFFGVCLVGKMPDGKDLTLEEYGNQFWCDMYSKGHDVLVPVVKESLQNVVDNKEGFFKKIVTNPFVLTLFSIITIKHSGDIINGLRDTGKEAYYFGKKLWSKATATGIDLKRYQECLERIKNRLLAELVGQDAAIKRIIDIMRGYFQSMVEAEINKEKFEGGLLLYLMGPSATGKSTTMKIIQEEMKLSNLTVRMSDATDETNSKASNVASRLLQPTTTEAGRRKIIIDSPLVRQLKNYVPTLYLFDEVDKMRKLDAQLSKSKLGDCDTINSIDELFRNFVDTGHIGGINASGSVLITTSNETMDDINRLDPSLANRYRPYIVEFRNFDENDYIEIIKRGFATLQKNYMNTDKVKLEITDKALRHFARKFVQERAGGRCAEPLMMQIRSAIVVFRKENDVKNRELLLDVDTSTGDILPKLVEEIDDTAKGQSQENK